MSKTIAALLWCMCLATGCGVGTQLGARPDAKRWSQIETPHFSLSTNLEQGAALEMARALEETRASLLELAWTGGRDPRGRTPVIVFARPTELEHYIGKPRVGGVAISNPGFERLLSFRPGGHTGIPPVVIHELTHELSQWFMPLQPLWFAEGLAEYLATLRYDRAAQQATIGEGSEDNLRWLLSTGVFIRSSRLLATRSLADDPREVASFYASSWLLVHYLLNREGEAFGQFQLDLTRLVPWQQAWQRAFPALDLDELDDRVLAYAKQNVTRLVTRPVAVAAFQPLRRVLSDAETHGVLALLSSRVGLPLAEQEMREALRLDPNELNALGVLFHGLPANETHERLEIARRAVHAHPDSGAAWLLLARAETDVAARAEALAHAARLSPDHPSVARLLGEADLRAGRAARALAHTNLAVRRSRLTPDLLSLHLGALAARGRCNTARALAFDADGLFAAECRGASLDGQGSVACGQLVRDAWRELGASCAATPAGAVSSAP